MKTLSSFWQRPVSKNSVLFLFLICFIICIKPSHALEQNGSVTINAGVDVNRVSIYGYTSPFSRVELNGIGVSGQTQSREDGYFEFNKTLLPKNYSELCLNSVDSSNRHTTPICIPPPPHTNYFTAIGPILLPPTLSINDSEVKPGSTVITSGQAIPNSEVEIHFYQTIDKPETFPKEVSAYSLPVFSTVSDNDGNFSLNLPTAYSSNYRLYATAKYQDNLSPKSNTLLYTLPSLWWLFLQQNRNLLISLIVFILNLIVLLFLLFSGHKNKPDFDQPAHHYSPNLYPEHIVRSNYIPE